MLLDFKIPNTSTSLQFFVLTETDVTLEYVNWLNDKEVNCYLESRFVSHTVSSTRDFVASILKSETELLMGIRSIELGKHIGNIKLGPISQHHGTAEIGLLIGDRSAWGKGFATEAIQMTIDIAKHLGLRKITAGCYESNIGSKRAFEKAGFVIECIRKSQFILKGNPENHILMGCIL